MVGYFAPHRTRFGLGMLIALGALTLSRQEFGTVDAAGAEGAAAASTCVLCQPGADLSIVEVTPAFAESLAHAYAARNHALFASIDSLLDTGLWGAPDSRSAQDKAHLLARVRAWNTYHYLTALARDPHRVYEASEATLTQLFERYSDVGLYPIVKLEQARMGLGRICARYDLSTNLERRSRNGQRLRIGDVRVQSVNRRMLSMTLPSTLFESVEVLFGEHFSCRVDMVASSGPPAPHRLFVMEDLQGILVRKWGTHTPKAFVFWQSTADARLTLPSTPLVGNSIYVPGIQLEMPAKLPNIGLENLRAIDLPQPIVAKEYARGGGAPAWLPRHAERGFKNWKAHGPVPPDVRLRFPEPKRGVQK